MTKTQEHYGFWRFRSSLNQLKYETHRKIIFFCGLVQANQLKYEQLSENQDFGGLGQAYISQRLGGESSREIVLVPVCVILSPRIFSADVLRFFGSVPFLSLRIST